MGGLTPNGQILAIGLSMASTGLSAESICLRNPTKLVAENVRSDFPRQRNRLYFIIVGQEVLHTNESKGAYHEGHHFTSRPVAHQSASSGSGNVLFSNNDLPSHWPRLSHGGSDLASMD